MSGWFCQIKAQKTGIGICRKHKCEGCQYHEAAKAAAATQSRPKTVAFLRQKIAQKRTHIKNEQLRLKILVELLEEQERG